ncbi:MAG: hypothetical protein AAF355_09745 [Myxococcota bacterium]
MDTLNGVHTPETWDTGGCRVMIRSEGEQMTSKVAWDSAVAQDSGTYNSVAHNRVTSGASESGLLFWICMFLLGLSSSVQAQSDERARLHFASGSSYFNVADYDNALREYQSAYELSGRPELLYNIALCHERLGDLRQAVEHMGRFLSEVEDIENRATLEERYANMQRRLERQFSSGMQESSLQRVEPTSTEAPEQLPQAEPQLQSATESSEKPEKVRSIPVAAIASFVGAGVGVTTFAVFGGLALAKNNDLESCSPNCDSTGNLRTYTALADVGLGLAVVGSALGVLFLLTQDGEKREDTSLTAAPWVGEDSAGLVARGAF